MQGVGKAHASKSAALLDSAFGGELSHHMTMMHDKEGGGGAVGKGEDIPARAETPVSIDRRQQGGALAVGLASMEAWMRCTALSAPQGVPTASCIGSKMEA